MDFKYKYLKYKKKYIKLHGRGLEAICKKSKAIPEELIKKINELSKNMTTSDQYKENNFSIKLFLPINVTSFDELPHDLYFNIDIKYKDIIQYINEISIKSFKKIYGDKNMPNLTMATFSFSYNGNHLMNIYFDFDDKMRPIQIERIHPDEDSPINISIDDLEQSPDNNLKDILVYEGGYTELNIENYKRTNYSASLIFLFCNSSLTKEYEEYALQNSS